MSAEPMKSWRDQIKVHPAADLFPMMPDAELDVLGRDIEENEQRVPVVFWTPEEPRPRKGPKEIYLIDGRNRLEAIWRSLGDKERENFSGFYADTLLYGNTDPWAYVVSVNVHRRHLTREQHREIIAALLKASPERSDRATAAVVKVSPTTVGTVRRDLEAAGMVSRLDTRTGKDGIAQPAAKTSGPGKEAQIRALRERQQTAGSSASPAAPTPATSRYGVVDELETLLRVVRGDRRRLDSLALEKRVDLVRQLMAFLKIEAADLGDGGP